ncbi:MAG TPA: DUF4287 domain-containing protein [Solimonas sp.]|nr:DUF4287 domain-containing protein [Solimonas sp.]
MAKTKKFAGISTAAVKKATGKSWDQWFALLDKAGAKTMRHASIAELLSGKHKVGDWWGQMVTVGYEQARGLRVVHQKADGFAASISKTFPCSTEELFRQWDNAKARAHWLKARGIEITKSNANKSMRMVWSDGHSRVAANFYPKGEAKTQVTVDHTKLASEAEVQESKASWRESLERLRGELARLG